MRTFAHGSFSVLQERYGKLNRDRLVLEDSRADELYAGMSQAVRCFGVAQSLYVDFTFVAHRIEFVDGDRCAPMIFETPRELARQAFTHQFRKHDRVGLD
jgi:hypothetical protein